MNTVYVKDGIFFDNRPSGATEFFYICSLYYGWYEWPTTFIERKYGDGAELDILYYRNIWQTEYIHTSMILRHTVWDGS